MYSRWLADLEGVPDALVAEADELTERVADAVLPARPTNTTPTEGAVREWEKHNRYLKEVLKAEGPVSTVTRMIERGNVIGFIPLVLAPPLWES